MKESFVTSFLVPELVDSLKDFCAFDSSFRIDKLQTKLPETKVFPDGVKLLVLIVFVPTLLIGSSSSKLDGLHS